MGVAVLDTASGGPDTTLAPSFEIPRSPREEQWYRALFAALDERYGIASTVGDVPAIVRRALLSIASRMPAYATHEVGAGAIDDDRLSEALALFYPQRWLDFFCAPEERAKISGLELARLNGEFGPLFDADVAATLDRAIRSSPYVVPLRVVM